MGTHVFLSRGQMNAEQEWRLKPSGAEHVRRGTLGKGKRGGRCSLSPKFMQQEMRSQQGTAPCDPPPQFLQ